MTRKKKCLNLPRKGTWSSIKKRCQQNRNASKSRRRKSDADAVADAKIYKDLQAKFKLKELRVILNNITVNNTTSPCQKLFATKNVDSPEVTDKYEQNTNTKIYSGDKKSSVNDIINTEYSTVESSVVAIEKHNTDEKNIEKQNIDNDYDIQNKVPDVEGQEICFDKHTELLSIVDSVGKKNDEQCAENNGENDVKCAENTDYQIAAATSNQSLCLDLLSEFISLPDRYTNKKIEEQNISFNEQNGDAFIMEKNLMKDTGEESLNETQKIFNQKETNKAYKQNSPKRKYLPKIIDDKVLAKNTISLKKQNNTEITNNLQDTSYCTTALLQNASNECLSIEKNSRVFDLTEDNLYKHVENYNKRIASGENIVSLSTLEYFQGSMNSNRTEINLKENRNDLHTSHKKRGWIPQKTGEELEKSSSKRIKLNRRRIQEKSDTIQNNSVCPSDNENSNLFSKCHSVDINNDRVQDVDNDRIKNVDKDRVQSVNNGIVQDMDSRVTLYSDNGNSLCTILLVSESTKTDFDDILRSTQDVEKNISINSYTTLNAENEKNESLLTECHQNANNTVENKLNEGKILSCSTTLDLQNEVEQKINDNNVGDDDDASSDVSDYNKEGNDDDTGKTDGGDHDNDNKNIGNDNCSNNVDSDDDDCISLFADSLLSVDLMDVPCNEPEAKNTAHDYKMTGNTFNKYLQQNILEFNKEFDSIEGNDTLKDESYQTFYQEQYKEKEQNVANSTNSTNSTNSRIINNNNSSCPDKNHNKYKQNFTGDNDNDIMTCTEHMELIECQTLCKGFCFSKMRLGDCNRSSCYFNHDLQTLIRNIILKYKQYLTSIIHYTCSMKYHYFLKRLYLQSLQECNVACIMDLYEKLYSIQCLHSDMVCVTVEALLMKGMHPKDVVDSLCKVLIPTDNWTSQYILTSLKDKIEVGEYWSTLCGVLTYIKPPKEVVESILNDCLTTRKHIQDVNINLIQRLHPREVNQLNKDLMLSFNNLLNHEHQKTSNETSPRSIHDNERSSEDSYVLRSISNLPETHSMYRDRFWKLYLMIHNIKEALPHEDYDYIISILNKYETINEDESLFSRCCFHMLTAEIKHSEYHISKIIEHAVQTGASSILYKVLLDIATYILMKLIIENAWVLAYKLLKTLQIYKSQHTAAFIILSAEIYLANQHAIKALMLIKQSNIISTNRDNWNVESNAQDYDHRTNIVGILLDVLCIKSPEHAFFIFQFLTKDQGNNFRPIDLTHYVDKLMLKLLIVKEIDLIIQMGHMIIEYNFTFFNITIFRAAIASIVHMDMVLAKQLYQYASGLGIYRTIELLPVIHVIINVDWVEEEIYLTFWDLFKRLVMDLGHSIDHLNPAQLTVYIIFEIVPTEPHLYRENHDEEQKNKIQKSKNLVKQVLRSRFEPSILVSKKKSNGKIIKLQNRDVINYLKAIYNTYIE